MTGMTKTKPIISRMRVAAVLREPEANYEQLTPTVRLGPNQPLVLAPQIPLEAIQELGPYRLIRQLGSGGMGIVFEAEDVATRERFAVKVLRPTLVADPEAKLRFSREAQAMAAIGHQRIVPVIRVGEEHGIPYIAMPLLKGETLEDRLQNGPDLTLDEVVRIGIEIAEGLDAAHRRGLLHRDIKPANVWLEQPFGSVRLLDLGLAREITRETMLTHTGIVMGTPSYMSPEQAKGEKLDPRSDLFSLGCILYQMTVGNRPFDGPHALGILQQLETYNPPRVSAKKPNVPAMLSNFIMELLAKNPKDRPASAAVSMDRLRRIPLHEAVRPPATPHFDPTDPSMDEEDEPIRPAPAWRYVTCSLLLAAASGLWYLSR